MSPESPTPREEHRPPGPGAGSGETPEYEDEAPGAYLSELSVGSGAVAWSFALLLLVGLLAVLGGLLRDRARIPQGADRGALVPLDVAWRLLPGAALAGFLIILFVRLFAVPRSPRAARAARLALWLHLLVLLIWGISRWVLGIGFLPPE